MNDNAVIENVGGSVAASDVPELHALRKFDCLAASWTSHQH
jgi:hypothetical protein